MASRVIRCKVSTGFNSAKHDGDTIQFFTLVSDSGAVANATMGSVTAHMDKFSNGSTAMKLIIRYNSGSSSALGRITGLGNHGVDEQTMTVDQKQNGLLTGSCSGIHLTCDSPDSYAINVRSGCILTLTINYTLNDTVPTAPALTAPEGSTVYNPRPRLMATLCAGTGTGLTVSCPGATPSRYFADYGSKILLRRNDAMAIGDSFSWLVMNSNTLGDALATVTVTYSPPVWTDPVLTAGVPIKAAHINEIRACLDNICDYYGLSRTSWAEAVIAGTTSLDGFEGHVTEMQETAARIAAAVNGWDSANSVNDVALPAFISPAGRKAAALTQLRTIVTML